MPPRLRCACASTYLGLGVVDGGEEVAPLGALHVTDALQQVLGRRVRAAGRLALLTRRLLRARGDKGTVLQRSRYTLTS